jgi:SWI/SNF-related matrix-associated actin-dependent regulator of chromatin subfamily A-like protein 1
MTTKLFRYQKYDLWRMHRFKFRCINAAEVGLGKTVETLFAAMVFTDGPVVVVCPATLKYQWASEVSEHIGRNGWKSFVLEKVKLPKKTDWLLRDNKKTVYIVNYDILKDPDGSRRTWSKFLRRLKPKLVVADEGHYLCNKDAARTKFFKSMVQKVPHVMILTATPVVNSPADLWSLIDIIDPPIPEEHEHTFGSYWSFCHRYTNPKRTPWGVKFVGGKHLEELNDVLLNTCLIRRLKQDVIKDLPPKTRTVVPVNIAAFSEYQRAERDLIRWLIETRPERASRARKNERIVKMLYLKQLVGVLKISSVKEWIDNFLKTGEKLIVFGVHKKFLRPLHEHYKPISVRVDGGVRGKKRQEAIDQFKNDLKTQLLFGNMEAAGQGWSAKGVSNVLFGELAWTAKTHNQAEGRIHGLGRGEKGVVATSHYLIGRNTIEERILETIEEKQSFSDQVIDGKKVEGGFDVYDRLEKHLLQKGVKLQRRKR